MFRAILSIDLLLLYHKNPTKRIPLDSDAYRAKCEFFSLLVLSPTLDFYYISFMDLFMIAVLGIIVGLVFDD